MTDHLWLNILIAIGIIGGAEEVLRRIVGKPVVSAWRKFERFLDTWNGEPARDGLPARPGMVDRVIAIEAQVSNNGGKSMKDAIDRIESASEVAAEMATAAKTQLDAHVEQSRVLIAQGAKDKAVIEARQDKHEQTIATLADAVNIAARSTPPDDGS